MCWIHVIYKEDNVPNKEFDVKVNDNALHSMETPYYVTVYKLDCSLEFNFVYASDTTRTEVLTLNKVRLTIGEKTGRIFSASIEDALNRNMLELKLCSTSIQSEFDSVVWDSLKVQNIKVGIEILKSIMGSLSSEMEW